MFMCAYNVVNPPPPPPLRRPRIHTARTRTMDRCSLTTELLLYAENPEAPKVTFFSSAAAAMARQRHRGRNDIRRRRRRRRTTQRRGL